MAIWRRLAVFFLSSICCWIMNGGEVVRFAWLTDTHVSPGVASEDLLRHALSEIAEMDDLAAVIVSGDLTNRGGAEELECCYELLKGVDKPLLVIPGNHETNWSDSGCRAFPRLFGDDRFIWRYNDLLLIGVASGPWLEMGDGYVRRGDILWLEETLRREVKPGDRVIFVCHYPLDHDLSNSGEILSILHNYPVVLTLAGHYHTLKLLNIDGIGGFIGRSISLRHSESDKPGYNILEVGADGAKLYNKELGEPLPDTPEYEFKFGAVSANPAAEKVVLPEPVSAELPDGMELIMELPHALFSDIAVSEAGAIIHTASEDEYSGMLSYGDLTISGTVAGAVKAVSGDGREVWRIETDFPVTNTGLIADGILYIGLGGRVFVAVDPGSGRELWRYAGVNGTFQARPAVRDDIVAFGAWDCFLYVLRRSDGELLWKWSSGLPQVLYSPGNVTPVIGEKNLAIVAPDRYLTIFDRLTGEVKLRDNSRKFRESLGASADGHTAYAKTMDGEVVVIDVDGAEIVKVIDAGLGYEHTPCPPAEMFGDLFVSGRKGDLVRIDLVSGRIKWRVKCGNSAFIQLLPAADGLLAVMQEGKIFRIVR